MSTFLSAFGILSNLHKTVFTTLLSHHLFYEHLLESIVVILVFVPKLGYLCHDFDACISDIFIFSLHVNFRGSLAFILCSSNKGKRDTTLSYLIMSIAMLLMFMFHATYYY